MLDRRALVRLLALVPLRLAFLFWCLLQRPHLLLLCGQQLIGHVVDEGVVLVSLGVLWVSGARVGVHRTDHVQLAVGGRPSLLGLL